MQERTVHPLHLAALGSTAIISQSIFVRELLALFTGTELAVGGLLASWLFWTGAGAIAGGRAAGGVAARRDFFRLAVLVAALAPVSVVGIRIVRSAIVVPPGALAPLGPALIASFLVVAPFAFSYGSIYNMACLLWRERGGDMREGVARVYLWEAAGSVFGAALFSFLLVTYFSQLEAALFSGLLLLFAVAMIPPRPRRRAARTAILFAVVFCSGAIAPSVDRWSIGRVFPGYRIERFYSSRFGEIVVADRGEVRSIFSGGARLYSYPEPERAQEAVHVPLLMHPAPRKVLLIGGSLGGGWQEAVKHPTVEAVDCVELDGSLFALEGGTGSPRDTTVERAGGGEGGASLARPARVRFIAGDGRFHLVSRRARYDAIIVSAPAPVNLQWNRFFTREFFGVARRSLEPGGILSVSHPSSENFLGLEAARALRCVELTLREIMPAVSALPGGTAYFVAGEAPFDPAVIPVRFEERGIDAAFVSADYLPYRFSQERLEEFRRDLDGAGETRLNSDGRPALPLYELAVEGSRMRSGLARGVGLLSTVPGTLPAIVLGGVLLVVFACARGTLRPRLGIWSVGFGSFLLQLLVLLMFQSLSGLLYHAIVLLTALFMAGAAVGAWGSIRRKGWGTGTLRVVHAAFAALAAALAGCAALLGNPAASYGIGFVALPCLALGGGALTGAYYPIVVRTALPDDGGAPPAVFYGWDLFGACAAGAVGGLFLFPLLGLPGTALFVACVHALAGLLLAGRRW